jgi:S1-C subfamily serine protease
MLDNYQDASAAKDNNPDERRGVPAAPENQAQNYPYPVSSEASYNSYPYQSQSYPYPSSPTNTSYPGQWQTPNTPSQMPFTHPYNQTNNSYGAADSGQPYVAPSPAPKARPAKTGFWSRTSNRVISLVLVLVLFCGLGLYLGASSGTRTASTTATAPATTAAATTAPASANSPAAVASSGNNSAPATGQLNVRQVAEKVRPAVVQITSLANANINSTNPFFGGGNSSTGQQQLGVGSGVVYDAAGYILTNFHVIDGASSLLVTLPDGRSFDGTVVGSDQQTDLAVVKIDPKGANLPVATLGDSSSLHVGDGLVAIGNALALPGGPTVTSGVVSALDRSVTEPGSSTPSQGNGRFGGTATTSGPQLYGLIQTDAAINPGNSGGPLVDMQGQVIGINTLGAGMAEPGVQAQGIGFAISINQAKEIAQQLVTNGKASHPFLGVSFQPLTPALANQLQLDSNQTNMQGAVLMQVQSGSPAAQAGLKRGDVITAVDGQKLTSESALGELLNKHKPGDKVNLEVITPKSTNGNNQTRTVTVTLAERTNG